LNIVNYYYYLVFRYALAGFVFQSESQFTRITQLVPNKFDIQVNTDNVPFVIGICNLMLPLPFLLPLSSNMVKIDLMPTSEIIEETEPPGTLSVLNEFCADTAVVIACDQSR
jgi:hypothetical protein